MNSHKDEKAEVFKRKRVEARKLLLPTNVKVNIKTEIVEKITLIDKIKTDDHIKFLTKALLGHFVFYNLLPAELEQIVVPQLFYCSVKAGDFIFKQNDDATCFFIIEKGKAEVIINEEKKKDLTSGMSFGELALLYNAPRSASIKAIENCFLWGIDRHTFRNAVEEMMNKEYEVNRKFIQEVKFFDNLTEEQKDAIAAVLVTQKFSNGEFIIHEGDPGSSFYIIKQGTVQVLKGTKEIRKMQAGDSFGEQALYYNTLRTSSCAAEGEVICLALGRGTLMRILGDQVQVIATRNLQKWAFEKSPILSKLTKIQTERILDQMKTKSFKQGEVVLAKGSKASEKLFIVMEGELKYGKETFVKGQTWGEKFLTEETKNLTIPHDLVMGKDGNLSEIGEEKLKELLGGGVDDMMKRNEHSHERKMHTQESDLKKSCQNLSIKDLIMIKKLGFGQFGSVFLVKESKGTQLFALKCVSKTQIVEQNLEKHLQQERAVCDMVNFPLCMQFMRTFKDDYEVYFLLEFIKGLELFDVIREIGLLQLYDAQYYIGSLILAMEYLHNQNIIYRDIKPENVMVDHKGIVKVIDMGTAKPLPGKKGMTSRTFTIIGTPHYMAPEILSGKGYNTMVDLWSIGICLYEFVCGMVPFGEEAEDPYEIYEEIVKKPITYPNYYKDKKGKKFIELLLSKVPEMRLGGSYTVLKANPWFDKFDWDKLLDGELTPPFLPPSDKMISDKDIQKLASKGKMVFEEIMAERNKGSIPKKAQSKDPNWDKDF